jgi:hypothetical protein
MEGRSNMTKHEIKFLNKQVKSVNAVGGLTLVFINSVNFKKAAFLATEGKDIISICINFASEVFEVKTTRYEDGKSVGFINN